MIGRASEAALLSDAFKRVVAGEGREPILISGEAGLGKTTLAAEAARRAHDAGACVLLGRCDEDLSVPYGPFVEALSLYVANAKEELLRAHVQAHSGELTRLVPAMATRLEKLPAPQSSDPDTERYLLFAAVVGLLSEASTNQPVVLVLDDLQWANKPSLQLVRHLVTSDELRHVLMVGAYRDSELSGSHPLLEALASLRREPGVSHIELKGLDDTGVIAFMEAAAGHDLDETGVGLAHTLYRETDGNPFFVGEVLRHLAETGAIYQEENGRWTPSGDLRDMALPASIRQVVAARAGRLGDRAGRALSVAAVIGRDFDLDLLARASDCDEDELLDIVDGATAAALVREVTDVPGHYSFSHVLVQHTLYQELGATRRARAHRKVAEALETICGDRPAERAGELARHWLSATKPVDATKAIIYARQAGDAALAALAPDDAARYFSQALQLTSQHPDPDPLLHTDLLLGLGTAQRQAGIPAFRETLLDAAHRAEELGASDRLVAAALANSRNFFSAMGVIDIEKVAALEEALAALPEADSSERALLLATLCSELSFGSLEQRLRLADEARAMARRLGDPATLVKVLTHVHVTALKVPEAHEERIRESEEVLGLAEAVGDPVQLYWAADFSHTNAIQAGNFDRATTIFAITKTVSDRLRQPNLRWVTAYTETANALLAGDPGRAKELATLALQIGNDSGEPDAFAFYGAQMWTARLQQGRIARLLPPAIQAASENPGIAAFDASVTYLHLAAGDTTEAGRRLEAAASERFPLLNSDNGWMDAVTTYAYSAIELEAIEPAGQLYSLLAP